MKCPNCEKEIDYKHFADYFAYVFRKELILEQAGIVEKKEHNCQICGKILTHDEINHLISVNAYSVVCYKHKDFAKYYDLEKAKEQMSDKI